jgi:hypothetical protein
VTKLKSRKSLLFRIFYERPKYVFIGKNFDAEANFLRCSIEKTTTGIAFLDSPYNFISQAGGKRNYIVYLKLQLPVDNL